VLVTLTFEVIMIILFVFSDFEIGNGVVGLERDVYLSIVKFLDSQIVRKV
jgi:hypothetical protein